MDGRRGRPVPRLSTARSLIFVAAWASLLLLPWYGVAGTAAPWPAVAAGLTGRPWLLLLLLLVALATSAEVLGRPRWVVVAAGLGLAWLVVEAFTFGGDGSLGAARSQPALGW